MAEVISPSLKSEGKHALALAPAMANKMRGLELQLPISRVKTIMKSSPEVENVGQDSLAVVTKATELFIQELAKQALKVGKGMKVDYSDVAEVVQTKDNLFFLREIIPRKITVGQYKELMKREGINDQISSASESSGEEEEDEDDDNDDDDGEDVEEEEEEEGEGGEDGGEDVDEDADEDADGDVENVEDEGDDGEEEEDEGSEEDEDEDDDEEEDEEAQR